MSVPFVDLVAQYQQIREEVLAAIQDVAESAQFILGEHVQHFEEEFAEHCGARECVGVASGTDALHLALRVLDIGAGDEVITAANSFAATAFAISYTGATPVFVDVNPDDYNLNVDLIGQAVTPRTKAVMPVHLYGQPANMQGVLEAAARYGLKVIEDASQAHGAIYRDQHVGALGDIGCFSFYPGKNLGAYGDGGAVVTNDESLADRLRMLRNYGQRIKNVHESLGYNSRLDTMQAAILRVKLRYLDDWTVGRRRVAQRYNELLADAPVVLPHEHDFSRHVYHLYVIQHPHRDALLEHMTQQGVSCGIHYPHPLPAAAPYEAARTVPDGVPESTRLSKQILSLPVYPEITDEQIQHVASSLASFFAHQDEASQLAESFNAVP